MGTTTNGNNGNGTGLSLLNRIVDMQLSEVQIKDILNRRAEILSKAPAEAAEQVVIKQYVTFRLGEERYAFDVHLVEDIQPVKGLSLIPCTPDFVVGAVNVRGSILPVIDLKNLFNLPASGAQPDSKIMVVKVGEIHMGILADEVEEVRDIGANEISPQIATLSEATEEFVEGVTDEAIIILDMASLASDKRMIIHGDV